MLKPRGERSTTNLVTERSSGLWGIPVCRVHVPEIFPEHVFLQVLGMPEVGYLREIRYSDGNAKQANLNTVSHKKLCQYKISSKK